MIDLEIEQRRPDQKNNRIIFGTKLTKEIFRCAQSVMQEQTPTELSEVTLEQFLKLISMLDYISSDNLSTMRGQERGLVLQMWNVLLQSNASQTHCTLGAIKRFLFVIEGLTLDEINRG